MSEEQGKRFHQDIKTMEGRYQENRSITMIADYCYILHYVRYHRRQKQRYLDIQIDQLLRCSAN